MLIHENAKNGYMMAIPHIWVGFFKVTLRIIYWLALPETRIVDTLCNFIKRIMHNNINLCFSRTPWIDWKSNNTSHSIIRTIKSPTQIQDDH